jgi:hypothetical protein
MFLLQIILFDFSGISTLFSYFCMHGRLQVSYKWIICVLKVKRVWEYQSVLKAIGHAYSPTVTSCLLADNCSLMTSCWPWVGWIFHVDFLLGFQGIETLTCRLWNVRTVLIGNQIVSTQPRKRKEKRSASQAGIYIPSRTRGEPNDYTIYLFGALIDFFRHQTSRYEYFKLFGHMLPWTHWDTSSVIFYVQDTVDIIVICQYVFSFLGLHMEIKLWTQIYFKHHLTMLSVGKISLVVL